MLRSVAVGVVEVQVRSVRVIPLVAVVDVPPVRLLHVQVHIAAALAPGHGHGQRAPGGGALDLRPMEPGPVGEGVGVRGQDHDVVDALLERYLHLEGAVGQGGLELLIADEHQGLLDGLLPSGYGAGHLALGFSGVTDAVEVGVLRRLPCTVVDRSVSSIFGNTESSSNPSWALS